MSSLSYGDGRPAAPLRLLLLSMAAAVSVLLLLSSVPLAQARCKNHNKDCAMCITGAHREAGVGNKLKKMFGANYAKVRCCYDLVTSTCFDSVQQLEGGASCEEFERPFFVRGAKDEDFCVDPPPSQPLIHASEATKHLVQLSNNKKNLCEKITKAAKEQQAVDQFFEAGEALCDLILRENIKIEGPKPSSKKLYEDCDDAALIVSQEFDIAGSPASDPEDFTLALTGSLFVTETFTLIKAKDLTPKEGKSFHRQDPTGVLTYQRSGSLVKFQIDMEKLLSYGIAAGACFDQHP